MFYFLLFISWGKVCLECINECRILMGCDVDVRGSLLRCFYFEFFVIGVCDMCFLWLKNCFILKFMIIMMIIVIIIYYIYDFVIGGVLFVIEKNFCELEVFL